MHKCEHRTPRSPSSQHTDEDGRNTHSQGLRGLLRQAANSVGPVGRTVSVAAAPLCLYNAKGAPNACVRVQTTHSIRSRARWARGPPTP